MKTDKTLLIRPFLFGMTTACLVLAMAWRVHEAEHERMLHEARAKVVQTVSLIRARLEGLINSHVFLAEGLVAHVAIHPDISVEEFQRIAQELIKDHKIVRSVQLAKDTVISHIYPIRGNEASLELRLLDMPSQRLAVQRAFNTGDAVVAGPVHLVQGSVALISRTPIFLPPAAEERGQYWGLANLLLDCDALYKEADLRTLTRGLQFAIRGADGFGAQGEIFYGDPAVFASQPVLADVVLPTGSWQLGALPYEGWAAATEVPPGGWIAGIVFAITVGLLIGLLAYQPQKMLEVNRQLEAARRQAERAAEERSRFLAAASHDLRQPLHALAIFISDLRERSRHLVELQPLVNKIESSAEALNGLLHSLMDISKLDAGVIKPQIGEFPLLPLLERLAVENAPAAAEKGLRLCVAPTRTVVHSDSMLLERLLRNLMVNAIKYTRRGGVLIGCRPRGGAVRIEVWDTGPGIPEDKREKIFEEFYQLGNPERDRHKGLGLGLAIVKRLAALLDYRLDMRSQVGRGSMFAVVVPRGSAATRPAVLERASVGLCLRGVTVLAVDDEVIILEAMRSLLEQWGCRAITARTGVEAEQALREAECTPDLILCDYRLPKGESGDRVIQRLREVAGAELPAFLISGDITEEVRQAALAIGCRLLNKPVLPAKLQRLLRNSVHRLEQRKP